MRYENTSNKTCILIAGPTATGKTSLSIQLASELNTRIISADSRQCFRELNIGVAKPSQAQLTRVRHYFINSHSIHDCVNAGSFEKYALASVQEIFQEQDVAVMVGGTGLYIKAFCEGIDEIPVVAPAIRIKINADFSDYGLEWLQNQVKIYDPDYFNKGEIKNPQRLMRALEIVQGTGRSILSYQLRQKQQRDFHVIRIGLRLSKEELHHNIDHRVNEMIKHGLADEVRSLFPFRQINALNTVGYNELFEYIDGKITLDKAIEDIKIHTRHYAKRQMTWFGRDEAIRWFHPDDVIAVKEHIHGLQKS
ncbi:MAG: tRNA (adenosine(37)-N6)-dimethylallyltransferase MiaA [Chitinophagaceae bacterium]